MFTWFNICCGSHKSEFDRAVMACTQSDWTVPSKEDIEGTLIVIYSYFGYLSRFEPPNNFR